MSDLSWLKGSIPPLITPFKNGEVDFETYTRLIERQIEGGSHGILVNGTTSEPSTLTTDERNGKNKNQYEYEMFFHAHSPPFAVCRDIRRFSVEINELRTRRFPRA